MTLPSPLAFLQYNLFFFFNFFCFFIFGCVGSSFLCEGFLSSCGKRGPLFIAVRGPLTIVASLVAEHRLQTRRLSSCGSWAQLLRGMWDPPRPGPEPVSPALAGRLSTTAPPEKPYNLFILFDYSPFHISSFLFIWINSPSYFLNQIYSFSSFLFKLFLFY